MPDTERFIHTLEHGPLYELAELLTAEPRRMNTFLSQPASHGPEQWMPMHYAARAGHLAGVETLLERGVHPDCRTRFTTPMHARQTPLHLAATEGRVEVIQRLLEAGAEVEVRDAQQRSPLWLAARYGHAAVVTLLARRGAAIDPRDTQQRTPLHAALLKPKPAAAQRLPGGDKAPDRSIFTGLPDNPAPPFEPAAALALLEAGADPNAACSKEPGGFTPLHRCVTLGDPAYEVAKRLITAGADIDAADPREGRTPHDLAIYLEREANWTSLLS